MMNLNISKGFLSPEVSVPFDAEVALEAQEIFGEKVTFDPVRISGTYRVTAEDKVLTEGRIETAAHGNCALCLNAVTVPLSFSFREIFEKGADETEEEAFSFEGKQLPLDQFALTLCLLHLPIRFTCEGECAENMNQYLGDAEDRPQPENGEETYYPFAGLGEMLKKD